MPGFPTAPAVQTITDKLATIAPELGNVAGYYVYLKDPIAGTIYESATPTDGAGNWSIAGVTMGLTYQYSYGKHPNTAYPFQGVYVALNPPNDSAGNLRSWGVEGYDVLAPQNPGGVAVGDSSTDNNLAGAGPFQKAHDAALNKGWVFVPDGIAGGSYKVGTQVNHSRGSRWHGTYRSNNANPYGSAVQGIGAIRIFNFNGIASNGPAQIAIEGFQLNGGADQIYAGDGGTGVSLRDLLFNGPSHAGIYWKNFVQEWYGQYIECQGGQYGFYHNNENADSNGNSNNLIDKTNWLSVYCHGQTVNGIFLKPAQGTADTWDHVRLVTCTQDGMVLPSGIRDWTFKNISGESNGYLGSAPVARVTATMASGSPTATVAGGAVASYVNGDTVCIAGAGNSNGGDLVTTISAGGGGAGPWTLAANAFYPVVNADVTKYTYSDVKLVGGPGNPVSLTFIDPSLGANNSVGAVKYSIDASGAFDVLVLNGQGSAGGAPIYDPNMAVSLLGLSSMTLRRPYLWSNAPAALTMYARPDGAIVEQMTLTGAVTLNNGPTPPKGLIRLLYLTQDGVGGRVTSFGTQYKQAWGPTTTAGLRNILALMGDGTSWVQIYSALGLPA